MKFVISLLALLSQNALAFTPAPTTVSKAEYDMHKTMQVIMDFETFKKEQDMEKTIEAIKSTFEVEHEQEQE